MGLDDRLWFLLVGAAIGFVLGYITRALREIKEELHDVEEIVKRDRGERGSALYSFVSNLSLVIALALTVYAAIVSQQASNDVRDTQDRMTQVVRCNQAYLAEALSALNERSTYSTQQARANVKLQKAQAHLLKILLTEPPPSELRGRRVLRSYFEQGVLNYIDVNSKAIKKYEMNPYPTEEDLWSCMSDR